MEEAGVDGVVAHSRSKERFLIFTTVCLIPASFLFILYSIVFLTLYTQAMYSVDKFYVHHELELKYFRFAWLSERVCNSSKPASFVTISCNATNQFNTTSRFNPKIVSMEESFIEMKESSWLMRWSNPSKEVYIKNIKTISLIYSYVVGPWLLLLCIPVSVMLSCMLPYNSRKLLQREVAIRKQKMRDMVRTMEAVMNQEYRGHNNNIDHHAFVRQDRVIQRPDAFNFDNRQIFNLDQAL